MTSGVTATDGEDEAVAGAVDAGDDNAPNDRDELAVADDEPDDVELADDEPVDVELADGVNVEVAVKDGPDRIDDSDAAGVTDSELDELAVGIMEVEGSGAVVTVVD